MLTNPSVLVLDEPTEGLGPVIVEALTAVLLRLRSEVGARTAGGSAWRTRSAWNAGLSRPLICRRLCYRHDDDDLRGL
jgi:hypothetical protein